MEPTRTDLAGLQTLDEQGRPPKTRLPKARYAVELVDNLILGNQPLAEIKQRAQRQRNGGAPFDPSKLRKAGQAQRTNLNQMKADSLASSGVTPFYDLLNSSKNPMQPVTSFGDLADRDVFNRIMAEKLHELVIKPWEPWHCEFWPMLNEFIWHGMGFLYWPDEENWEFEWIEQDRILFPLNTQVNLRKLETFVIIQNLPVHILYEKIKDETVKGWNKAAVEDAIRNALPDPPNPREPMQWERLVNEKSFLYDNAKLCTVPIANVYVREFDGKWSHLIVLQPMTGQTTSTSRDAREEYEFLYEARSLYDEPQQIIRPFLFDVTHKYIHENNGMAKKVFSLLTLDDRVFCARADGVFLRAGVNVQAMTPEVKEKMSVVQMGTMNVFPAGLNIQPAAILSDIKSAYEFSAELSQTVASNTGVFRPQIEKQEGNPPTAAEFIGRQQQASVLTNSAVDRFYDQADRFATEFFRRVLLCTKASGNAPYIAAAKRFKQACIEEGVPKEAFDNIEGCYWIRASGNGSPVMRQQIMGALAQIMPRLPEDGQENFVEDFVAVFAGQSKVNRYMPAASRRQLPTQDESFALLENAAIKQGAPVTWEPSQNSVIHAQTHLKAASEAAQSLQQGANMAEVYVFIEGIGQHVAQHLSVLQKDPTRKDVFAMLEAQFKQLATIADSLKDKLQQQAQQQQEQAQIAQQTQAVQQGTDPELQLKAAETQKKLELQKQKQDAQLAMKANQAQQKMAINDAMAAQKIRLQHAEHQTKTQIQKADQSARKES